MKLILSTTSKVILVFLLSITPLVGIADNPNVKNYKVSDVQLGMSEQEALDALVAYYSINTDDFQIYRNSDAMPITGYVGAVDILEYYGENLQILITFAPDLDRESDGYMVVSELQIGHEDTGFKERLKRALSDYGSESLLLKGRSPEDEDGWTYLWCEKIE